MGSNTNGFTLLLPAQLLQSLITYTKVMRYLVLQGAMDIAATIFHGARMYFYGTLVDADSIRQDQPVVVSTFRLRDAVVEAQQLHRRAHSSPLHRLLVRPVFDHYRDVIQFLLEDLRELIQCLGYEALKDSPIHNGYIIALNSQSVT